MPQSVIVHLTSRAEKKNITSAQKSDVSSSITER